MASNTPNLGLLKKDPMTDGNETFNIETMLNENWDKIDTAVGQVREGLENVNVDIPDASLTEKGIVQLSSATNGTRENVAATEKAVKAAYDEALAGKQLGVEQKANVVAALNSIGVSASTSETWAQLVAKMAGVIRATGNANPADVLAGKTFSNASGNGLTGTMPNRGAGGSVIPGTINQTKAEGYYSSAITILGDPNLIPGNIRAGVNIFGINGELVEGKRTFSVSGVQVVSSGPVVYDVGFRPGVLMYLHKYEDIPGKISNLTRVVGFYMPNGSFYTASGPSSVGVSEFFGNSVSIYMSATQPGNRENTYDILVYER